MELPDEIRVPLDELHADARYLFARVGNGTMSVSYAAEVVQGKIEKAKAGIEARLLPGVNLAFQDEVRAWCLKCFGPQITMNVAQRNFRFLEEAIELVQANGMEYADVLEVLRYVWARPKGEVRQEAAGTVVTLAALCNAVGIDLASEAALELRRVQHPEMVERIRAKQAAKPNAINPGGRPSPDDTDCC